MTLVLPKKTIFEYKIFPEFSEIQDKLIPIEDLSKTLFVSHRWETKEHPDPAGKDLQTLIFILKDIPSSTISNFDYILIDSIWIDYCCVPQKVKSEKEKKLKKYLISQIDRIQESCYTLVLWPSSEVTSIKSRAWCLLELIVGVHSEKFYLPSNNCTNIIEFAENFLIGVGSIPSLVATNGSDIQIIKNKLNRYYGVSANTRGCIIL
jgi:hypothetical protein